MSNQDDLNDQLQRAFRRRKPDSQDDQGSDDQLPIRATENAEIVIDPACSDSAQPPDVEHEKMGIISRFRARNAESEHELQKARLTYETEIGLLKHKADAALRESRVFWDAKSVEVTETIKTYVQSTIRALEIDRLGSRNDDLQRAYESAAEALKKANTSRLPEVMKDRLIQDILTNFENTVDRIQKDTIVARYDLD